MKKRYGWLLLAVVLVTAAMLAGPMQSAGYDIPSLFHNDEAWYKDSVAPLLLRDERYYIPVDMLSMFADLQVSYYDGEENILLSHKNGTYASILFEDRSAAVNGKLTAGVGLFRENGYTYVEADWVCALFSLTCTYEAGEDGRTLLRITDGTAARTMEELLRLYREEYAVEETEAVTEDTTAETETSAPGHKRIYIVTGDNRENPSFIPAEDIVENSGLVCTLFLHERSKEEKFWAYVFPGQAGLCVDSLAEAEEINDRLESQFCRRVEYVLPAGEDTDREALRQAGYVVIEPDFVVDYSTDPDLAFARLVEFLETHDEAIVQVSGDGCSQRMIALLCNLTAGEGCRAEALLP